MIDLHKINAVSKALNFPIYLVGGAVRDFILNLETTDWDFAVIGDSQRIASDLAKEFDVDVRFNPQFLAATILTNPPIDFVSTRSEIYTAPGSSPICTQTDLKKDLRRRDFTVNAMAISLDDYLSCNKVEIIDLYGGIEDLKQGNLRVLHNKSFFDDPARIIRLLRYKYRFSFQVEKETEKLLEEAVYAKALDYLPIYRLEAELTKSLSEDKFVDIFMDLLRYNLFDSKDPNALRGSLNKIPHCQLEKKIFWKIVKYIIFYYSRTNLFMSRLGYQPEKIINIKSQLELIMKNEFSEVKEEEILFECLK